MRRLNWLKLVACGLVGAVVLLGYCKESSAQPWPHHPHHPHHGHHHHGHHHSLYRPYYPPIVARYAPVYPLVVRPSTRVLYSVLPSNPAPAIIRVAIVNPEATGTTLSFTIDGERYDLAPGSRQEMRLAGVRTIVFDRGESFGQGSVSLLPGVYVFRATAAGWGLERQPLGLTAR